MILKNEFDPLYNEWKSVLNYIDLAHIYTLILVLKARV